MYNNLNNKRYFADNMNVFDGFIVTLSLVDFLISKFVFKI
jgi:hypothetical protein